MDTQDPIELLTPDERQLYELMRAISEGCYCAGWMNGNEFTLWSSLQTGELTYGMGEIDRELLAQVAALSVKTGKWIVWRDDHDGEEFADSSTWGPYAIPLAEWGVIYDSKNHFAEGATQPAMSTTFDRRWSLARDGLGLERNDESGEYVDYHDAISVLHATIDATPAQDQVAAVRAPSATPKHIEEIKDLLLWPVTEDDARVARDMLQSIHFDLSMDEPEPGYVVAPH